MYAVIIAAVLALTNFSIKPNPKAPRADAILEHAVDDADFVFHLDVAATVGANYQVLTKLAEDPLVKQVPELRESITQAVMQVEGGRSMAKGMMGFDPVTDVTSLTGFAKVVPGGEPEFLLVVRGNFAADLPSKLAGQMGGKAGAVEGRSTAEMPDGTVMGTTKGGALLLGKGAWVTPRLASSWKASARAKGSAWARIATALDARPFFLIASKPSAALVKEMTKDLGDNFGRDLLANHTVGVFAASATGVTWMYEARDAAFAKRMATASEGLFDLMRAAHLAPRGMVQVAVAALPSYAKMSKEIDAVVAAKDKLMAAVWDMTGDGKFVGKVKVDGNLVTATATGKRFSEVVPASFVVGLGAIGFMTARGEAKAEASGAGAAVKATPVRPTPVRPAPARSGGGLGTPVKPKTK